MNRKLEGVVLTRRSFQDAHRIITFYTNDFGKVTCIAKGVKKPKSRKAGHLEPGTYCNLFLAKGRNLDILTEVETKKAFGLDNLATEAANEVYHLLELTNSLTEPNQKNQEVFNLLVEFLEIIGTEPNKNLALAAFKIKLLSLLGFFSTKNLKESNSKKLLDDFESEDFFVLKDKLGVNGKYLKLLVFLDSIIEKIAEKKLKTNRFINAHI